MNLECISHDNAFLSFYPHQFTQRTLLARFQMNDTVPPHTQFFQKPVYGALTFLSNLGKIASASEIHQFDDGNFTQLESFTLDDQGKKIFVCTLISLSNNETTVSKNRSLSGVPVKFSVLLTWHLPPGNWHLTVELLGKNFTDPYQVWRNFGSPAFPNKFLRNLMRKRQESYVEVQPFRAPNFGNLTLIMLAPTLYSIRICNAKVVKSPEPPYNVRFNIVNKFELIVLWSDRLYKSRCIFRYQLFFKPYKIRLPWTKITRKSHVTVHNFHFSPNKRQQTSIGCYKVRSIDIAGRKSPFSKTSCLHNL